MSACPSHDVLLGLLDERLQGQELDEIVIHVEACQGCQERLEQLTRGLGGKTTQKDLLGPIDARDGSTAGATGGLASDPDALEFRLAEVGEEDRAGCGADGETTDFQAAELSRTLTQSGPANGSSRARPEQPGAHRPRVPGYEILEPLGEGGMGVVYKARESGLNRLVALKMIRGGTQARLDHVARFRIEAEAVARLRHSNIIQIFYIGEVDGLPFVSLELLEGGSLADRVKGTPQPAGASAALLSVLALAVDAAHRAGIVHRDLKPTNVLFTEEGTPKITDFGLAKRLESTDNQTESGQIMGSPSYMAPEQARGDTRDIGPAADVYALGAILYEMLTGRPPFKGETPMETIRQVIDDEPVPPSRLAPRLPRDLETITLKCLNKEPHKRYGSAHEFADDLGRYARGEPIKARPTPLMERGYKWARRRPFAATAAVLVPLFILISFVSILNSQRSQAEKKQRDLDRIMVAHTESTSAILAAQKAMEQHDLTDAKATLTGQQEKLARESAPNLKKLKALADSLLVQIEMRLTEERSQAADRTRYDAFLRSWNETLIQDTQFTGLDKTGNQEATRRAARAALAVFAADANADTWALGPLPSSLTATEHGRIKEGCYELLLVLAGAVDRPAQSLEILEQAARIEPSTTAYHRRRAAFLSAAGDANAARRELDEAEATAPTTALDHFLIGHELFKGNPLAANRHFDLALSLQPDHFWAQCFSGLCYLKCQQPELAKVSLTGCIQRERGYAWLYAWRALASGQLAGDPLRKRQLRDEKNPRESADHHFLSAVDDYKKAETLLERKPDNLLRWVLLVNRGLLYVQHEDWEKASADLEAATRLDERRPDAFAVLARVYQAQHQPDKAFDEFSRAIALKPDSAPLYRARADAELARPEQTAETRARALHDLEEAIRFEAPDNPVVAHDQTKRARLLFDDHRYDDALSACQAALTVEHDRQEAHQLRIEVLLSQKKYQDMKDSCDALLVRHKTWAAIYELRGMARALSKDHSGAIEDFTQAIAIQPGRATLFVRRGGLYLVADAPKLALRDFDEAVGLDAADSDALSGRGAARVRLGRHREAVADAEKAVALGQPTAQRLYSAARIYARAAAVASAEVRKNGNDTVSQVSRYLDRGAVLLRDAVKKLPAAERAAFWRDVVQADPDPAMSTLRRRLRSGELVGERGP